MVSEIASLRQHFMAEIDSLMCRELREWWCDFKAIAKEFQTKLFFKESSEWKHQKLLAKTAHTAWSHETHVVHNN